MTVHEAADLAWRRAAELRRAAATLAADVAMLTSLDDDDRLGAANDALETALAELAQITAAIAESMTVVQQAQVETACATGLPLRLNIGSGPTRIDGWVGVDLVHGDVLADIRRPLPFPTDSASHIYACLVLEHLGHPDDAWAFLRECRRVLRRGGKIRVVVPDIGAYLVAHAEADESFWTTHAATWPWSRNDTNRLDLILAYAGAGTGDSDFFGHRHGYDERSLRELMVSAGLAPVRRCGYQQSTDPTFLIDDRSAVAHVHHRGRSLSLFAEAFHLF